MFGWKIKPTNKGGAFYVGSYETERNESESIIELKNLTSQLNVPKWFNPNSL